MARPTQNFPLILYVQKFHCINQYSFLFFLYFFGKLSNAGLYPEKNVSFLYEASKDLFSFSSTHHLYHNYPYHPIS